jgi:predicted esterase
MNKVVAIGFAGALVVVLQPSSRALHTEEQPVPERYALGQRLRAFERAWEVQTDPAACKRATAVLKRAVPLLFAAREADVAVTIDQSRFLLGSAEPPSAAVRWAESLVARPSTRLLDPGAGDVFAVLLTALYDAKVELPAEVVLRLSFHAADGTALLAETEAPVAKLPTAVSLSAAKLRAGDHTLRAQVVVVGKVLATYQQLISIVPQAHERLAKLQAAALAVNTTRTTDTATLRSLTNTLASLAAKGTLETDYPAARLFAEAEGLAQAIAAKDRYYGAQRTGEFWLTLATSPDTAPVRVFVPEAVKAGKAVPLVVVLHGAGGSENLFFDGYGDGKTVRVAKEHGWMVVGTRVLGLLDGPPPVPAIIDELAKLYPVDRQHVYAIGHSMGATHAVALAQKSPKPFAALAALGGGGSVTKPDAVKGLPVYVGCGTEDFALATAKNLAETLGKAGAKVTYKEFPDVEHIVIVQESAREVFSFFEKTH